MLILILIKINSDSSFLKYYYSENSEEGEFSMYALVCWSITDGIKPRSHFFTYKVELKNLGKGDVVLLENTNGEDRMGVFLTYMEKDFNPQRLRRVKILKKVHTNTIKAHLRKRYNEFKGFQLPTTKKAKRNRRNEAKVLFNSEDESYLYWKIMRIICFGNRINSNDGITASFYYKNKVAIFANVGNIWVLRVLKTRDERSRWVRPTKSHYILVDLFKAEKTQRIKL